MADSTAAAGSWTDALLKGVNALIDSQSQKAYLDNVAAYNTQQGLAGQAQATAAASATNKTILIGGGLLLGALVLVLVLRR